MGHPEEASWRCFSWIKLATLPLFSSSRVEGHLVRTVHPWHRWYQTVEILKCDWPQLASQALNESRRRALPGSALGCWGPRPGREPITKGRTRQSCGQGVGPVLAPRTEIPVKNPPSRAWGSGSRPRHLRAAVANPTNPAGARVSGRKRLSKSEAKRS